MVFLVRAPIRYTKNSHEKSESKIKTIKVPKTHKATETKSKKSKNKNRGK